MGAGFTVPVVVATAQKGDLPVYFNGIGTVTAFNTVTVRSRVDGAIVKVNFTEGQFVHQGDALIEMGDYDAAADAYQKMVELRPDLASYNRAAHYRFLFGDTSGAIRIMKQAIEAGSSSPENVAWCMVDLGGI